MYEVAKLSGLGAKTLSDLDKDVFYNERTPEEFITYKDVAVDLLDPAEYVFTEIDEEYNFGTLPRDPRRVKPMFPRKS